MPGDDYDAHFHHSLLPCYDPGEDLDNHHKHIHNPLLTGYDPEDDYDIHCDYNDHDFFYDYIHH